jgi:hypothetical protein
MIGCDGTIKTGKPCPSGVGGRIARQRRRAGREDRSIPTLAGSSFLVREWFEFVAKPEFLGAESDVLTHEKRPLRASPNSI